MNDFQCKPDCKVSKIDPKWLLHPSSTWRYAKSEIEWLNNQRCPPATTCHWQFLKFYIFTMKNPPRQFIEASNEVQQDFLWNISHPKIKHSSLIGNYEGGGSKDVNISKILLL